MSRNVSDSGGILRLLVVACLLLWATQVIAQDVVTEDPVGEEPVVEEPVADDAASTSNPPAYIADLLERTELTEDQMTAMRTDGAGWGEIRIAASLAEQMVAKSLEADPDSTLTFEDALGTILEARLEGKGYGEIAQENELKIGQLMRNRNRNQVQEPAEGDGLEAEEGVQAGEAVQIRGKKRGLLSRLGGFLGFGRAKKVEKAERVAKSARVAKVEKVEKVEKPAKPEKPERPEKPEKPEKPERPEKPEKPEKPERGPRR